MANGYRVLAAICCCCCVLAMAIGIIIAVSSDPTQTCFDRVLLNSTLELPDGVNSTSVASTCAGERVLVGIGQGDGVVEVYEYDFDEAEYNRSQTLSPPTPDLGLFGNVIATDCRSGWLAVGEPGADSLVGRVHVYLLEDGMYELITTLENPAAPDVGEFGASLSIACYAPVLVVGAPQADGGAGAVYLYDLVLPNVTLVQTILSPAAEFSAGSTFGASVSLACDASKLAVGVPGDNLRGAVGIYDRLTLAAAENLTLTEKLAGVQTGADFGASLSMVQRGQRLVVGSPMFDGLLGSLNNSGQFTVFERSGPLYLPALSIEGGIERARFGHAVSAGAGGRTIVVSAWSDGAEPGEIVRYICPSISACQRDTTLVFGPLTGAGAVSSYSGTIIVGTQTSVDAAEGNTSTIGILDCADRQGTSCPSC